MDVYHPHNTMVNDDKMAEWLRSEITGDLEEVPGRGPAVATQMKEAGINTTYQLLGKYLEFKDCGAVEHQDRFWYWLKANIPKMRYFYRSSTTRAIALKVDIFMPGIYSDYDYEEERR